MMMKNFSFDNIFKVEFNAKFFRDCLFLIALAFLIFAAAKLGLSLAIPPNVITAVWPPAGIALAAVLWKGKWVWPAIWLGTLFGSIPGYQISALLGVGAVLQALAGA